MTGSDESEVIDHGVTGFVVDTLDDAIDAAKQVHRLNRETCRAVFERRFNVERMAAAYLRLYERLVTPQRAHLLMNTGTA